MRDRLTAVVRRAAAAWPRPVASDETLDRALRFLADCDGRRPLDARTVTAAAYAVATAVVVAGCPLAVALAGLVGPVPGIVAVCATATVVGGVIGCRRLPVWLAAFRRTRALGAATTVVGLAAARMRLDPVPERAARFAARTAEGPLAAALGRAVAGARTTPTSGLAAFASAWREWFPALERATASLVAAADTPSARRSQTLDRATAAVTDELESRTAAFAEDLRGPVTALYAFGVLLPLALVAALPAAAVAGVPAGPFALAVGYDCLLPAAVIVAGARLTLARPVAFPPPAVAGHPALPAWRRFAPVAGVVGAATGWVVADTVVAGWATPVAAAGAGIGATATVAFHPTVPIRERVRRLERGLPDALALVGRRVADGASVERAVAAVGERVPGPTGDAFTAAARRRRTLGVDLARAFREGPLAHTPSPRADGVARLLAAAAREGRPAGTALVDEADRLDTLADHERRARRAVRRVTDTLLHTAAVFGPLVGGATVRLAGRLADSPGAGVVPAGETAVTPATLGPIVGGYVLWLAVVLPTLATALERGLDRSLVGYRVGLTACSATVCFLTGAAATGLFV